MPFEPPIQVLVVDDDPSIRRGITCLINSEWPRMSCAGSAASAHEALTLTKEHQPNVVILDVNLGDDDGLAMIPVLRRLAPCEIVVLTGLLDPRVVERGRDLGASVVLNKAAPATELVQSILTARRAKP